MLIATRLDDIYARAAKELNEERLLEHKTKNPESTPPSIIEPSLVKECFKSIFSYIRAFVKKPTTGGVLIHGLGTFRPKYSRLMGRIYMLVRLLKHKKQELLNMSEDDPNRPDREKMLEFYKEEFRNLFPARHYALRYERDRHCMQQGRKTFEQTKKELELEEYDDE